MPFTVARTIKVPIWDDEIRMKAVEFWTHRRITFKENSDHVLTGQRGSLTDNLISFDPSKLIATLTITSMEQSTIDCVLTVNTSLQTMTDWTTAFLELEMATFESYLLHDDSKEELWKRFSKSSNRSNLLWTLSLGMFGAKMSSSEKSEFKI